MWCLLVLFAPLNLVLSFWAFGKSMNLGVIDSCCTSTYLAGYMLVWKIHDESRLYVEVGMYQITTDASRMYRDLNVFTKKSV